MIASAEAGGLTQIWSGGPQGSNNHNGSWHRYVNRTRSYYTGMVKSRAYAMHMMGSKTADRSWSGYTLTETGTVTEELLDGSTPVANDGKLRVYDFDGSSYLQAANVGTGFSSGHYVNVWVKPDDTTPASNQVIYDDRNTGSGAGRYITLLTTGIVRAMFADTTVTETTEDSDRALSQGEWHMITAVWREGLGSSGVGGSLELYIDGMLANEPLTYDTSLSGTIGTTGDLTWGAHFDGSSDYAGKLTLGTVVDGAISPKEVMEMYQHDAPAFLGADNVVMLKSATTDAVLDVDIDPVTGLLDVIQTDDRIQFQGAIAVNEPSIASGGTTWEHGLVWGGATLGEINDANLFLTRPAQDVRGFADRLFGLEAYRPEEQYPMCIAIMTSTASNGSGDGSESVIGWNQVVLDTHKMWGDVSQFQSFHCRVPGWYTAKIKIKLAGLLSGHTGMNIVPRRHGNTESSSALHPFNNQSIGSGDNSAYFEATFLFELDEDDMLDFRWEVYGSTKTVDLQHNNTYDNYVIIQRIA